jgi:hypothetical protein
MGWAEPLDEAALGPQASDDYQIGGDMEFIQKKTMDSAVERFQARQPEARFL